MKGWRDEGGRDGQEWGETVMEGWRKECREGMEQGRVEKEMEKGGGRIHGWRNGGDWVGKQGWKDGDGWEG